MISSTTEERISIESEATITQRCWSHFLITATDGINITGATEQPTSESNTVISKTTRKVVTAIPTTATMGATNSSAPREGGWGYNHPLI